MPAAVPMVVVIISDDVLEPPGTDAGLNWQLAPLGSPVQERATTPTNPKLRMTVTVDVTLFPATTGVKGNGLAEIPKLGEVLLIITATPPQH